MINDIDSVEEALKKLLLENNIVLSNIEDRGRYYFGTAKRKNKEYLIKVAKTKRESNNLQNDTHFNKKLNKLNPPFVVPNLELEGELLEDFYYKVENKIIGKPFASLKDSISVINFESPEEYFEIIIDMVLWIQSQKITLPKDISKYVDSEENYNNERIIETMIKQSYNKVPKLSDLLKIVLDNKLVFENIVAHRDVTPINIIIGGKNKIALVDLDIAKKAPKYYDIIEFYNRLWTRVCKPELANRFLKKALSKVGEEKEVFYNHFLVVSALRSVGNYWEIMQLKENQKKRLKFAESYIHHIVDKEFLLG